MYAELCNFCLTYCYVHYTQLLEKEANRLIEEQPTSQDLIEEKQTEIFENWEQLTQRADTRKTNLEQSRELQRFLADLRDLVTEFVVSLCSLLQAFVLTLLYI